MQKKIDVDQLPLETAEDENKYDDLCDDSEKTKGKVKKRSKARVIRSPWFNKESNPEKTLSGTNHAFYALEK